MKAKFYFLVFILILFGCDEFGSDSKPPSKPMCAASMCLGQLFVDVEFTAKLPEKILVIANNIVLLDECEIEFIEDRYPHMAYHGEDNHVRSYLYRYGDEGLPTDLYLEIYDLDACRPDSSGGQSLLLFATKINDITYEMSRSACGGGGGCERATFSFVR